MSREILLIVLVNLVMYFRVLRYDYIIDDAVVPKKPGRNFLHTFWLQLRSHAYCNPEVEHLQRVAVHMLVCVLIYLALGADRVSLGAALLFSVNPSNNQGIAWLNGIGYSMAAVLVLLMIWYPPASPVVYLATLWWHVTAFPAPLVFIPMGMPLYALALPIYVLYAHLNGWRIPFGKVQENATLIARWESANLKLFRAFDFKKIPFVVKCYAYYFFLSLIPKRLGLYHSFGYAYGMTPYDTDYWGRISGLFWVGLGILAGSAYVVVRWWGEPVSFGVFWWNVFIVQWCNVVTLQQTLTDRYCYLPNIGLMYAISWLLLR